ncbi:MAG: hypothetical protein GX102_07395 [Porphyromonadaceae bacterium]|nr:hypothetical protein [Porphyromonadaceae bacterium]
MSPEELGVEIGKLCAEAFDFIYEQFKDQPEINDELKKKFSAERERIFSRLVPLIKQQQQLSEEGITECNMNAGITVAESIPDMEEKSIELLETIGNLENEPDQTFLMDVQSLYMILSFLDMEEMQQNAPELLKYVGF